MKLILLDIRDGLLGVGDALRKYIPHLLTGLGVFAGFIVLMAWGATTTMRFENESEVDLRAVVIIDRTLEGVEKPLWQLDMRAGQTTYKFATGCCDWLVLRYKVGEQTYDRHCRISDWMETPDFSIVFPKEGPAYCTTCRWCLNEGKWN